MTAEQVIDIRVPARDQYGNVATGYPGTAHFDAGGAAGTLPPDDPFQPSDPGTALFLVTLSTPGPVRLTVTDTADGSLTSFLDLTVS